MENKNSGNTAKNSQEAQQALAELKKSLVVIWLAFAFCVSLTLYRYFAKGIDIQLLYVLLIGVLLLCAISTTIRFIKVKRSEREKR